MSYGHFDDEAAEYVITDPETPRPWINYIGREDYVGMISNTGGGYSFYQDPRHRRLLRYRYNNAPRNVSGRGLYLRDAETGEYWSPTWQPARVELDDYECRHGTGYTTISARQDEVESSVTYFVPSGEDLEAWRATVSNDGDGARSLQLFSLAEFCLWDAMDDVSNYQRNYNTGEVEIEDGTIYHKTEYRERRNHFAYFACSADVAGFDTQREAFLGSYSGFDEPEVVETGESKDSIAHGWSPIGSHQIELDLEPGESEEVIFLLGYAENPEDEKFEAPGVLNKERVTETIETYLDPDALDEAFAEIQDYWDEKLSKFQAETPDDELDRMVNVWNQYQNTVTMNLARSASLYETALTRGIGFRDSNQDQLAVMHAFPDRARQRLLNLAAIQHEDGGADHQYTPLTGEGNDEIGGGFNDYPLWLIMAVAEYVKETDDDSILEEEVVYENEPGTEEPLADHLQRALNYTLERLGPHDLPLIGHADWNDCLNLNCFSDDPDESFQTAEHDVEEKRAESVFIAGQFVYAACELADLAENADAIPDEPDEYRQLADEMAERIEDAGWDGEWFRRAYDHFSDPVGSSENEAGQIFVEPQVHHGRRRLREREGPAGAGRRARAPGDRARNRPPPARVHRVRRAPRRDHLLPAGVQGERQRVLPHQPLDRDRRGDARQRRARVRLLQSHLPCGPRGDQRDPHLRAVRLRPDHRRAGRTDDRGGQELVADRHGRLELRRRHPAHSGRAAVPRRPRRGPVDPRRLGRLQGDPRVPRHDLRDHRREPRRR